MGEVFVRIYIYIYRSKISIYMSIVEGEREKDVVMRERVWAVVCRWIFLVSFFS